LLKLFRPLASKKSPFVNMSDLKEPTPPHYLRPKFVGEVQYVNWTTARRLRHPTWRGLRPDKQPADVVVEQ
jgi:bifunctional non-homologous end joining protein LigD